MCLPVNTPFIMKCAIISSVVPPSPSGQAVVLYQLLKEWKQDEYIFITSQTAKELKSVQCTEFSQANYFFVKTTHPIFRYCSFREYEYLHTHFTNDIWALVTIFKIVHILTRNKCTCILACSADVLLPYCSYIASRIVGIPFYFYAFDDQLNQWLHPSDREFARKVHEKVIKGSQEIIVPNEFLKAEYFDRYGCEAIVIHNPVDLFQYQIRKQNFIKDFPANEISIVFTGAIYEAHYDSFFRLIQAIIQIEKPILKLHLYSNHLSTLPSFFIHKNVVFHSHLPHSQIPMIQQSADILFLPLTFGKEYERTVIRTASPGKLGEYLASKRPILVHAPQDSFIVWYFETYKCGRVVDNPDINKLRNGLLQLINDPELRNKYQESAYNRAIEDFELKKQQWILKHLIDPNNLVLND